jgi:hypothetical protein
MAVATVPATIAIDPEVLSLRAEIDRACAKITYLARLAAGPASSWVEANNRQADLDAANNYLSTVAYALLDRYRALLQPVQPTST